MKKVLLCLSLLVFLAAGSFAVVQMAQMPPTYDGAGLDMTALYEDPANYDTAGADGSAALIVQKTLAETHALNAVTAVVFDFRGYDTMGEAFILITAIAGCLVILHASHKKEAGADERE